MKVEMGSTANSQSLDPIFLKGTGEQASMAVTVSKAAVNAAFEKALHGPLSSADEMIQKYGRTLKSGNQRGMVHYFGRHIATLRGTTAIIGNVCPSRSSAAFHPNPRDED
jgi:hypothetical protein